MKNYTVMLIKFSLILVLSVHCSFIDAQTNLCEKVKWSPDLLSKLEKKFNMKEDSCSKVNIGFEFKVNYPKFGLNFKDFNSKIENLITISKSENCKGYDIFLNQSKFQVFFNISEVYARKFRREIYLHKGVLNKRFVSSLYKKCHCKEMCSCLVI